MGPALRNTAIRSSVDWRVSLFVSGLTSVLEVTVRFVGLHKGRWQHNQLFTRVDFPMQLLSVVLLALSFTSFSEAAKTCKCLPGDPCFPSQATWNAFARTLSRPLISDQRPFASVCYNTSSNFSPSQCSAVVREEFDAATLATLPNTVQLVNFEELVTNGTVQSCPPDPAPGDICQQGRVPTYGINATTIADIQKTITFASKYNLHLVVKNTG